MKFEDIPAVAKKSIRVKSFSSIKDKLNSQPILSLKIDNNHLSSFEVYLKDHIISCIAISEKDFREFAFEMRGHSYLAEIVNIAPDNSSFEIRAVFFNGQVLQMGDVQIGIDEYTEKGYIKTFKKDLGIEALCRDLENCCVYQHGNEYYFFIMAGAVIENFIGEDDFEKSDKTKSSKVDFNNKNHLIDTPISDDHNDSIEEQDYQTTVDNAEKKDIEFDSKKLSFCVCGERLRFVATPKNVNDDKVFIASKLTKPSNKPERNIKLVKGKLKFVDWAEASNISLRVAAQLNKILTTDSSYLKKWDEYGEREGNLLLKKARNLKLLHFSNVQQNKGNCSVIVDNIENSPEWEYTLEQLADNKLDALELVDSEPIYMTDQELTFKDFVKNLMDEEKQNNEKENKKHRNLQSFKVLKFERQSNKLYFDEENISVKEGFLCWSILGDSTQIKRREMARDLILNGCSVNNQLGLIIEENGNIIDLGRIHKVDKPLSNFVREKVFKNEPTAKQIEAIDIALNTPDIALIQGPPGTGKTTVIAAILERLNELNDKNESIKGKVLLSGFQHDAVENLASRVTINGLPVFKYGKRSNNSSKEDDFESYEKELRKWCLNLSDRIRKRNPQICNVELENKIKSLCFQYTKNPSMEVGKKLLDNINNLPIGILDDKSLLEIKKALDIINKLGILNEIEDEDKIIINSIRNIRVLPESFADDGQLRAMDLYDKLQELLDDNEKELLKKASEWVEDSPPPFLNELATLKRKLLIKYNGRPFFPIEKYNYRILELAKRAINAIKEKGYSLKNKKEVAIAEFLNELENNIYGMIDTISDYSYAFAATCQQSASKGMAEQKGIQNKESNTISQIIYDYVIVDEAARVSPRDLLIPMVQGKKIILVGDHRQLPHIINEEVAQQMEVGEEGDDENDWLKLSMFQYLFSTRLKQLEEKDHIKRRVTLDVQYRMNPILGDFVSENFYECFDKNEKFMSGLPIELFAHNLPETNNKPACWIDLPLTFGKSQRSGTSWIRPIEAKVIIEYLIKWLNTEEGKKLTFGVISFYKKQADFIENQFKLRVVNEKERQRVKIGTVDSFQGMEFDVVFLSMVRTDSSHKYNPDKKIAARQSFGHLCLTNRLNVAMSRQKRLLVLVGDSNLTRSQLAELYIRGIYNFYRLCQNEGVVIDYGRS